MITPENTLLCVFSFNMGHSLQNCLSSIKRHCPSFRIMLADDASDDPVTLRVIDEWKNSIDEIHISLNPNRGRRHGNLYENIQWACDRAAALGFRFLFMIQDDMQFVLPLSPSIANEYGALFDSHIVLQVDPRFARREGSYEIDTARRCYHYPKEDYRRSYSDVGILDLQVLRRSGWKIAEGEPMNKRALTAMGLERLFPFTPIMMHVPFPPVYRDRRHVKKLSPLRRGGYGYHDLTAAEMQTLSNRPIEDVPYFRKYLRPKNMYFSRLWYAMKKDGAVFR